MSTHFPHVCSGRQIILTSKPFRVGRSMRGESGKRGRAGAIFSRSPPLSRYYLIFVVLMDVIRRRQSFPQPTGCVARGRTVVLFFARTRVILLNEDI